MSRLATLSIASASLLVLAACGSPGEDALTEAPAELGATEEPADDEVPEEAGVGEDTEPATGEQVEGETTERDRDAEEAPPSGDVDESLETQIEQAVGDTAEELGVDEGDVEVLAAERVTWNDGSLGCPDGDSAYTQALVDGYRILLSVDGSERAYHGQDGHEPIFCSNPQDPTTGEGGTVDR